SEIVADEQLIDDELHLLGVEIDVTSPPALETQIARRLGVDLGIEIVLLGPKGVRGILILEVLYQPSAVELAVAEVAGEGGQPAPTKQAAAVAHRVLAVDAGPIRQRRAGDDNGTEQLRTSGGEHHDRPSRLAIADDAGLSVGRGVERCDLLEKNRLGAGDILDGLARYGVRQEADEIAGMPALERNGDFAVRLE